tara:strand:+ start:1653 stop:2177 length:525 start_codon:yes stop_codon:yes gene_type:complete
MAEAQFTDDFFIENAMDTSRPLPGESLTNDPDTPLPFEGSPQFTDQEKLLNYYFELLTSEDVYENLMDALEQGFPVMDMVQTLLLKGFEDGLFNPDLMMIVAEPLAYMMIALAERQNIDVVITSEDDEDEESSIPMFKKAMSTVSPTEEVPEEIQQRVEPAAPSLLAREEPQNV